MGQQYKCYDGLNAWIYSWVKPSKSSAQVTPWLSGTASFAGSPVLDQFDSVRLPNSVYDLYFDAPLFHNIGKLKLLLGLTWKPKFLNAPYPQNTDSLNSLAVAYVEPVHSKPTAFLTLWQEYFVGIEPLLEIVRFRSPIWMLVHGAAALHWNEATLLPLKVPVADPKYTSRHLKSLKSVPGALGLLKDQITYWNLEVSSPPLCPL